MSDLFTTYKIIILFILEKVGDPVPHSVLAGFLLDKGYTTYFNLNQALAELVDTDLIAEQATHDTSYYHLTEAGKKTSSLFCNDLSKEIRTDITNYLTDNKFEILEAVSLYTDYTRIGANEYVATCSVKENGTPLLELRLGVSNEQEAQAACRNWKDKSASLYEKVITELLGD